MDKEIEDRLKAVEAKAQQAADLALAANTKPGSDILQETIKLALSAHERGEGGAFQAGEMTVYPEADGIHIRIDDKRKARK